MIGAYSCSIMYYGIFVDVHVYNVSSSDSSDTGHNASSAQSTTSVNTSTQYVYYRHNSAEVIKIINVR